MRNPGYLVKTKKGSLGRTYHNKGTVNNKIPVYLYESDINSELATKAILCNVKDIKIKGFID